VLPFWWWPRVVVWKAVVGGRAISLCFLSFFPLGDDHTLCVMTDVNNFAEVAVGVVERVAVVLVTVFCCALVPESSLLIADPTVLVEIQFLLLVFMFDGDCLAWLSRRSIMTDGGLDFCHHYQASIHVVGEVLVEFVYVVVTEADSLEEINL
jgi:hypothetical protein